MPNANAVVLNQTVPSPRPSALRDVQGPWSPAWVATRSHARTEVKSVSQAGELIKQPSDTHACMRMYVCMHACMHASMRIYIYMHVHTCILYVCMPAYIFIYACVYVYILCLYLPYVPTVTFLFPQGARAFSSELGGFSHLFWTPAGCYSFSGFVYSSELGAQAQGSWLRILGANAAGHGV